MDLRVVAPAANRLRQRIGLLALDLVGAVVGVLGFEAGQALGLVVVLLQGEADGVGVLHPAPLALVDIAPVEPRESYLAEAQLAGRAPYVVSEVLAVLGGARRLDVTRYEGGLDERLHALVVALDVLGHVVLVDGPNPVAVGSLLDVLALKGLDAAVEGHIHLPEGYARDGGQVLRYGDLYVGVPHYPSGSFDAVADLLGHATSGCARCAQSTAAASVRPKGEAVNLISPVVSVQY